MHTLAASNFSFAALLMERVAEQTWLHGEAQTLYLWIMQLPDAAIRDHAHLVLNAALYLLNTAASVAAVQRTSVRGQVERMLLRVENAFRHPSPLGEPPFLRRRLRLLRAWSASLEAIMAGDGLRLRQITQDMPTVDDEDEVLWHLLPLSNHFILHSVFGREGGILMPRLLQMQQRISQESNHFATLKVMQWLALAAFDAGMLHRAHQECLAAQEVLHSVAGYGILPLYFWACQGDVLYQWNRLDEGKALQRRIIQEAATWQKIDVEITGYLCLTDCLLAEQELIGAHQALQQAEYLIRREHLEALCAALIDSVRVRYWLATGDRDAAGEWASHVTFDPEQWDPMRKRELLMLVRVYCAQRRYGRAIETLERFTAHFERPGDVLATSAFLAVTAVALQQAGQGERSLAVLARLLQMTEPEGIIRVYLDEGDPMRQLLEQFIEASHRKPQSAFPSISLSYASTVLAAFAREKHWPASKAHAIRSPQDMIHTGHTASSECIAPLTPREHEVLRLLAAGASNQDIANRLVITLTTVKKHVGSLLAKLVATNRTHAVARARELSLL